MNYPLSQAARYPNVTPVQTGVQNFWIPAGVYPRENGGGNDKP